MSAFISPLAAIARALSSTSSGSEGTRRFWPHGRDRCRSLTLIYRNSPCWLSCECCNNVLSSFWLPLLAAIDWAWLPRGMMCVNWNELQYLACATASRNRGCNAATRSAGAPRYWTRGICGTSHDHIQPILCSYIRTWACWRCWSESTTSPPQDAKEWRWCYCQEEGIPHWAAGTQKWRTDEGKNLWNFACTSDFVTTGKALY